MAATGEARRLVSAERRRARIAQERAEITRAAPRKRGRPLRFGPAECAAVLAAYRSGDPEAALLARFRCHRGTLYRAINQAVEAERDALTAAIDHPEQQGSARQ